MKKVILNAAVLGLNNEVINVPTGRTIMGENNVQRQETRPVKFGFEVLKAIMGVQTKTDEEATAKWAFAKSVNENLNVETPTVMELSDEDFAFVQNVMSRQPLTVKARFIEMVAEQNV
jgi:hypothetical protein